MKSGASFRKRSRNFARSRRANFSFCDGSVRYVGISVGSEQDTPDYGAFEMRISLTPEGLDKHQRILALVFSTVAKLQREGVPGHLFKERQTLARLDEIERMIARHGRRRLPMLFYGEMVRACWHAGWRALGAGRARQGARTLGRGLGYFAGFLLRKARYGR